MKRVVLSAILGVLGMAPAMFADVPDYMLNVNGITYCPSGTGATCSNNGGLAAAPVSSTVDETYGGTGPGTVNMTYSPGVGSYNIGLWVFEMLYPASGQNEYGATGGGSPSAGEKWQIDTPDYDIAYDPNTGLPTGAGSIIANTSAFTLANTNYIPGTLSQYSYNCGPSVNCNDYTSMSLSYNFTLGTNQDEVLSFSVSTTAPASGFYLMQVAPVDSANTSEIDYYYSATAATQNLSSGTPEPSFGIPMLALAGILCLAIRRRSAAVQG